MDPELEYDDGPPINKCNCQLGWPGEIGWTLRLGMLFALIVFLVEKGACP